jgi:6-phosphogluconolactonase (cycloisomerase 2 family)
VTVFAIDPDSGRLEFTGTKADVPTPTCIRFRPAG